MADEFQLVAGHLALDFANTLDYRYDPDRLIDLLPSYERFLAFCRQSKVITAAQMRKLLGSLSGFDSQRVLDEVIEIRNPLLLNSVCGAWSKARRIGFTSAQRVPLRGSSSGRGRVA
jgi:predicted RNA-binding Zn ribbon-like protein